MKRGLSSNQIKLVAIIAMTIDHLAWTLFPGYSTQWYVVLCHILGRLTAPIMWFFVAEGFHHTRNVGNYAKRLFLLALVSHFAYDFCFGISFLPSSLFNQTSVAWSLAWGLVLLCIYHSERFAPLQKTCAVFAVCLITFPSDWSCIAAMAVLFMGLEHGNFSRQMLWMMVWTFVYAAVYFFCIDRLYALIQLFTCLTIPLLKCYNGQRGSWKGMGTLFYFYYPVHLFLLGLLRLLLWGADSVTAAASF